MSTYTPHYHTHPPERKYSGPPTLRQAKTPADSIAAKTARRKAQYSKYLKRFHLVPSLDRKENQLREARQYHQRGHTTRPKRELRTHTPLSRPLTPGERLRIARARLQRLERRQLKHEKRTTWLKKQAAVRKRDKLRYKLRKLTTRTL